MEYQLKFKNGRSCEIECQETGTPLQDKINRAEQRFGSPVETINGKQVKEHGLGGFLIGTLIGGAVASKTGKKPVKSGSAKKSARAKDRKYVNADEDYETRYSKDKPARKGYANRDVMNLETMKTGGKTKENISLPMGLNIGDKVRVKNKKDVTFGAEGVITNFLKVTNAFTLHRGDLIEVKFTSLPEDVKFLKLGDADLYDARHLEKITVEGKENKTYAEGGSVGTGGTMDSSMGDAPTIGGTMASSMYAKGGGVFKFPVAIKRRIDEINEMMPKVKDADEIPGGYFGSTHYSYVELLKPIEIKGQYVYVYAKDTRNHSKFEKRYNVKKVGEEWGGLKHLKNDLSIIYKAFKDVLKPKYAKGGGIYSSDDVYTLKVYDLDGKLLDDSKMVRARNISKAKEEAIDLYEYAMQQKYGTDLRFQVELAPSRMAEGGSTERADFENRVFAYLSKTYPDYTDAKVGDVSDEEYDDIFFEMVDDVREKFDLGIDDEGYANELVEDYMSSGKYAGGGRTPTRKYAISGGGLAKEYIVEAKNKDEAIEKAQQMLKTVFGKVPKNRFSYRVVGKFAEGGGVDRESVEMLRIQSKEAKHHAEELSNALKGMKEVEPWTIAKMERATTDLSDVTHYLDGKKYAEGGRVYSNKEWEVIGITLDGKMFRHRILLGRKSDENDVKNALRRRTDLNIREITSIKEVFEEGGGVESEKRYRILSPDGFDIVFNQHYSKEEVVPAFEEWKKRYEQQGYYSTSNRSRISLEDLADEMTVIEADEDYLRDEDDEEFALGGTTDERELAIQKLLKGRKYPLNTQELKSLSKKSGFAMGDIEYVFQKMNNDLQYSPKNYGVYATGGMIGKDIVYNYYGEQKIGTITEILPSGDYVVHSGMTQRSVSPSDVISEMEHKKKRFGFFKSGGLSASPKKGYDIVGKTMREFKEGKLRSSSGDIVTNRDQAIAIGLSKERRGYFKKGGAVYPDLLKIDKPDIIQDQATLFDVEKETPTKDPKDKVTKIPEVDITIERNLFFKGLPKVNSSISAVEILRKFWANQQMNVQEHFYVMLLSQNNKVISVYHQAKGGIASTTADIELTCAVAVKSLARGVIVAHNHPSGELRFSEQDKALTKKLATALKTLDILLFDSVVVTDEGYISMADDGILPNP